MTLALFNLITASLFVYAREMFFHLGGGPEFFEDQRGGDQIFFSGSKGGGPKFFYVCKGGDQKDRRPPLPVKNDSFLRMFQSGIVSAHDKS